jgi:hypothetical protein
MTTPVCAALSGPYDLFLSVPRAAPWADMGDPFGVSPLSPEQHLWAINRYKPETTDSIQQPRCQVCPMISSSKGELSHYTHHYKLD